MTADQFLALLPSQAATFTQAVSPSEGEWIVKGFVDVYRRVYAIRRLFLTLVSGK